MVSTQYWLLYEHFAQAQWQIQEFMGDGVIRGQHSERISVHIKMLTDVIQLKI